ncbi:MAG TPA: hypothetical protein VF679_07380 [Pedobacter sp.]
MKRFTLIALLIVSSTQSFAQEQDKRKVVSVTSTAIKSGSELQKMLSGVKITDPKIYDRAGNVVDSLEAIAKVKSFLYTLGWAQNKDGEYKRTIFKIDPEVQVLMDANMKKRLLPKSLKLREGVILDLKPMAKKLDLKELEGKSVLLIFWCDGCYSGSKADAYAEVNEVLTKYKDPEKFEILAVTHHSIDEATRALSKSPIVNTRHILAAGDVNQAYETGNRPVLVLTDKSHKILYSITGSATMTPRILNNTLKEIL